MKWRIWAILQLYEIQKQFRPLLTIKKIKMKSTQKMILISMAVLILSLFSWNIYLHNTNVKLNEQIDKVEEKYQYLESFTEVLQYDLTTAQDSVRILEEKINAFEAQEKRIDQ